MYIIITSKTIQHEGDERSRKHPGHGYPAYSEEVSVVEYIEDFNEFKKRIEAYEHTSKYFKKPYKVFEATPLKVTSNTSVSIST